MLRQRLRARTSPLAYLGRALLVLASLALVWYGIMLLLLALKFSPDTVNALSGYRDAYDYLAGLDEDDASGRVRLIAGLAGLAAFFLFGLLAWKEIPRPYLARSELALDDEPRGVVTVEPRAIERAAESAALEHPGVSSASARFGSDDVAVDVEVRRAREVAGALHAVQGRVREALRRHGLPALPVNVTLTGFDRKQRRELA